MKADAALHGSGSGGASISAATKTMLRQLNKGAGAADDEADGAGAGARRRAYEDEREHLLVPFENASPTVQLDAVLALVQELSGATEATPDMRFFDAGMSSAEVVQFVRRLERLSGMALPSSLLFQHSTARAVVAHLQTFDGKADGGKGLSPATGGRQLNIAAMDGARLINSVLVAMVHLAFFVCRQSEYPWAQFLWEHRYAMSYFFFMSGFFAWQAHGKEDPAKYCTWDMATVMLRPLCPSYWVVWLSMGPFYLYDIFGPCFPNIIYALSLMANFTLFESISPLYAPMGVSMVQGWTLSCQVGFCMCFNHMRRWMHIPTAATLSDGSFKRGVAWQLLLCCVICTVQSIIDAIVAVVKDMGMNVGLLNVAVSFLAWNLFALFWLRMPFFYIGMLISQICEHAEMNARQLRLLGGFVDLMCVGWLVNLAVTAMNPNPTAIPHPGVANYTRIAGAWIQIFNVAPWVLVLVGLARARSFLGGVLSHPCARRRRGQADFPASSR